MPANLEDKKLIERYLEGDEKSLEDLVKKYVKPIYSFVFKNVGGQTEAEDITQEVFLKMWKNLKKFDQKKDFKPWIFQIAKNSSIDFLRKKKTVPFSMFENEKGQNILLEKIWSAPLNLIEDISDKRVVAAAMQGLNDKEQKVIYLRYDQGFSFKEIAGIFKEPINTVKSRCRRALSNMRNLISG